MELVIYIGVQQRKNPTSRYRQSYAVKVRTQLQNLKKELSLSKIFDPITGVISEVTARPHQIT